MLDDMDVIDGQLLCGDRTVGSSELHDSVTRAAAGFAALGVGPQGTVAILLRNDIAFVEASLAASVVGACAVPINWHFQAEEAGYILRDSQARVLVVHADLLSRVRAVVPAGVQILVVPVPIAIQVAYGISAEMARLTADLPVWPQWLADQTPGERAPLPPPSTMIYTSGTTGAPKGVRRAAATGAGLARFAEVVETVFGFRAGETPRTVVTGPLYHAAPNAYGLFAVRRGGGCVLQPRFDAEELLQLIERYCITHLHMVPTMFVRLLKLPEEIRRRYDLSSLRFVVHAAAPCAPEVKRRMIEWWGPVINEYYGSTETSAVVFCNSEEALRKPGTVGRPLPGTQLRILDDDGRMLGAGQIGEVYARVEGMPDFTYHGRDDLRRAVERDGFITVGDVGFVDDDGYLFLCDRKKDMVISGGVNIYPAEIEAVLLACPGVRDCAVFGIPDEEYGEALCAYVEPEAEGTLSESDVRTYLLGRLARYKVPGTIEFRDHLPREDSGKIFKRTLRAPYWERTGRQI